MRPGDTEGLTALGRAFRLASAYRLFLVPAPTEAGWEAGYFDAVGHWVSLARR
jgi:hypothetical protein